MRTTIAWAARLLIPRSRRDRVGLAGGGEVDVELYGAAIRIEPASGTQLQEKDGLLVIPTTGQPIEASLVLELIDGDQHRR